MEKFDLFETAISIGCVNSIDIDSTIEKILDHQRNVPTVDRSNTGGYQGHGFKDPCLKDLIKNLIPQRADKPIKSFEMQTWVNVNDTDHWNDIHQHNDPGVLLSGIIYIKTPKKCGNLRLYDPRFFLAGNAYFQYYNQGQGNYITVEPKESMIIFFPPYLPHMVEPNRSDQTRMSIAFNIVDAIFEN